MTVNILATRTIQYRADAGAIKDVVLTVFEPLLVHEDDNEWQCAYQIHPPEKHRKFTMRGQGWVSAFLGCLVVARGYIEHPTENRTSWQGMLHAGLPWYKPCPQGYQAPQIPPSEQNPGNLEVLTRVRLGAHDDDTVHEILLTLYRPFLVNDSTWKCAFAFGAGPNEPVRYGTGADFIEALLDCLAFSRLTYNSTIPATWKPSELFETTQFWPYKIDREYSIDRTTS